VVAFEPSPSPYAALKAGCHRRPLQRASAQCGVVAGK
jgi:hypothetical protein